MIINILFLVSFLFSVLAFIEPDVVYIFVAVISWIIGIFIWIFSRKRYVRVDCVDGDNFSNNSKVHQHSRNNFDVYSTDCEIYPLDIPKQTFNGSYTKSEDVVKKEEKSSVVLVGKSVADDISCKRSFGKGLIDRNIKKGNIYEAYINELFRRYELLPTKTSSLNGFVEGKNDNKIDLFYRINFKGKEVALTVQCKNWHENNRHRITDEYLRKFYGNVLTLKENEGLRYINILFVVNSFECISELEFSNVDYVVVPLKRGNSDDERERVAKVLSSELYRWSRKKVYWYEELVIDLINRCIESNKRV